MNFKCIPQKFSLLFLGLLFTLFGLGALLIGVALVPFFGMFASLPFFLLAYYFYRLHLNRQCEIPESDRVTVHRAPNG